MSPLFAGIVAGAFHVVSGPDHLVAVTPLAVRSPARAIAVGAWWGAGHAVGAALLGALGAVARTIIDINFLSSWAEFLVGLVLCGVGIWAFIQARRVVLHRHSHDHAHGHAPVRPAHDSAARDAAHDHLHLHVKRNHDVEAHRTHHGKTSFGVGVLHGAAGTGHLLGVLPSLALPPLSAAIYLAAYGAAAVASMTAFAGVLGVVGRRLQPSWLRVFLALSGLVAVSLGTYWMTSGFPAGS